MKQVWTDTELSEHWTLHDNDYTGSVAFFDFCKLAVFIKRNYPVRANA